MPQLLSEFWHALWGMALEAGVWLLVGFSIAGVIHAWLPRSLMQRVLGGRGMGPVARAAVIGAPMPLCSCSVIPAAASLRRGGAGKGASASFAIATPEVDAPSVSITWAMIGPVVALARPIVAIATAIAAGLSIDRWAGDRHEAARPGAAEGSVPEGNDAQTASCCGGPAPLAKETQAEPGSEPCCASRTPAAPGFTERVASAARFSFWTLPKDLAFWLIFGLVLSAVIVVAIPDGWIEANLESGALGPAGSKLLMLVIGVPWYVCATASTPLAAALIAKGLSPGAALVFLLAGPATNPATMGWVFKDLGGRALVIYLATISLFALGAGFALDALFDANAILPESSTDHEHGVSPVRTAAAVLLSAILMIGLLRSLAGRLARTSRGGSPDGQAPSGTGPESCCGSEAVAAPSAKPCCGGAAAADHP